MTDTINDNYDRDDDPFSQAPTDHNRCMAVIWDKFEHAFEEAANDEDVKRYARKVAKAEMKRFAAKLPIAERGRYLSNAEAEDNWDFVLIDCFKKVIKDWERPEFGS